MTRRPQKAPCPLHYARSGAWRNGIFSLEEAISSATACAQIVNNGLSVVSSPANPTITASFTTNPNLGLDLSDAAAYCGFLNFDWQQTVTNWPSPSPLFQVGNATALIAPLSFLDPPLNGYTYEAAQYPNGDHSYPFYYDPTNGELDSQNDGYTLSYYDTPADPCLPRRT